MPRFSPYLGFVVALAFGIFIFASLSSTMVISNTQMPIGNIFNANTVSTTTVSTSETSTTSPIKTAQNKTISLKPTPLPISSPPVESQQSINASLDISSSALRAALVNIICYSPSGSAIHSISGSGIIVDPKGIILTNAHIGQYFLLADRGVSCTIRSGTPASDAYTASLIYISPSWLKSNPNVLTATLPSGNGQYDFAFLAITKSATTKALPSVFSYLPIATAPPNIGTPVVIASYGAQFLGQSQIRSGLSPTIVFGSIKDVFTFGTNTIDVLSLGGSAAAQEGSSGGGVANASGVLIGTITTSTVTGTTDTRTLDAISASYIRAEYASETGQALDLLLEKPTAISVIDFEQKVSELEAIITAHL